MAGGDGVNPSIEREIPASAFESMGADVHVGHYSCATTRSINGKGPGKTEDVQDCPAMRQCFHSPPVLALIQKEAGLLTAQNIGFKLQAAFEKMNWAGQRLAAQDLSIGSAELLS